MRHVRHSPPSTASITAAGSSGPLDNLGNVSDSGAVVVVITVGAVSGTTPSWTPRLQASVDGTNWVDVATFTAITAAGTYRLVATNIFEPKVQVAWAAPTGTTPNFQTVQLNVLFPVN